MSEHGLAVIRMLFDRIDAADWNAVDALFHPEATYERPGYPSLEGSAAIMQFYRHERAVAAGRHHIEGLLATGDRAACWGVFVGSLKTGIPVAERFADAYTLHGARILRRRTHFFRPAI